MQTEIWDVYDRNRKLTGRTHKRGVPVPKDDYHLVVAVWTIGTHGKLFITKRSGEKKSYPGLWENSGGCAKAGETSLQAAVRELYEETGIKCEEDELDLLVQAKEANAFIDTYLLRHDVDRSDIVLQKGETEDAKWVTPGELEALIAEGLFAKPIAERMLPIKELLYSETERMKK